MEKEIKDCSESAKILYDALKKYNISGLYNKVVEGETLDFFVIMPEIAKGDIKSHCNIYIDIEEYGVDENDGFLSGEFTLNFGMSHSHFTYGYVGGTVEQISEELADTVQLVQNRQIFSFSHTNAAGLKKCGFREMLKGVQDPKHSYELEEIMKYYRKSVYKNGMPEMVDSAEVYNEIEIILKKSEQSSTFQYYLYNDEKPITTTLFQED